MATSRYKYFQDVQNTIIGTSYKGFPVDNFSTMFSSANDISYKIPVAYQYRPDLIANYFYGDPTLFWILAYANKIYNTPEGFETDVVITIPYIAKVMELV